MKRKNYSKKGNTRYQPTQRPKNKSGCSIQRAKWERGQFGC